MPIAQGADIGQTFDVALPRLGRDDFVAALKSVLPGESEQSKEDEARSRSRKSSRSLTVYRRLFPSAVAGGPPEWARPETGPDLIPVLLAGRWKESNEADRLAVSDLADTDYESIVRTLARWNNETDPPIRRIGDSWLLSAPLDAWSLLSRYITRPAIERYEKTAINVLGEHDPSLDLEPGHRWLASIHGTEFEYSGTLREGLADSLVFLSVIGAQADLVGTASGPDISAYMVSRLLCDKPPAGRWRSLARLLPTLAEAAPDAFIAALDQVLEDAPGEILALFEEEGGPTGGGGRHPGLLWALEVLAWYPKFLGQAAKALAKLARLDPGGKLANRPSKSLGEIFCTWHPNTAADLAKRMQVLDVLLEREPEVAWELISDLLPESHSVSSRTSEPRWRPKPEIGVLTYGDVWRANEETIRRSLTAAHRNGERLADLTPNAAYWRPEDRAELRQAIEDFSANSQDQDQRGKLWHAIRAFLGEHRRYPDADWSLSEEELSPFEPHLKSLEPEDILERVSWVFDDDWSFDYRDAGASQTRREAVVAVSSELGIDGVLSLARRVKLPHVLGDVLVDTTTDDDMRNELLERCLGIDDQAVRRLGVAFVYGCQRVSGAEWSDGILTSARFAQWPASKQADFCLGLPVRPLNLEGSVQPRH